MQQETPENPGFYGEYGGQYVAETLVPALSELDENFQNAWHDTSFRNEFSQYLETYVGRPSPLYLAQRLTDYCGGARIFLKREDLNHTGAHKINNTLGQALLAKRAGKKRLIAETGAGMHGVATATVAALFGLDCDVYMGTEDIHRQKANVDRMRLLNARVIPVETGAATLKDALNEALKDWVTNVEHTFYVLGTVAGPHPYPTMVKNFQRVIGDETRRQFLEQERVLPDDVIACVGGGSNAIGMFSAFIQDNAVALTGVEAGGEGVETGHHAASIKGGKPGILHGNRTWLLQDENGQITPTHSISAGLDYPGVGPELVQLKEIGRAEYTTINDDTAVHQGFILLSQLEGILPALESAHAVAAAVQKAPHMSSDKNIVINLSGRGDKDMQSVAEYLNDSPE